MQYYWKYARDRRLRHSSEAQLKIQQKKAEEVKDKIPKSK